MTVGIVESCSFAVDSLFALKKEKLQKAFLRLEDQQAALTSCILCWGEVEEYLSDMEKDLQRRFRELCEKEKAFELKVRETEEAFCEREAGLVEKEHISVEKFKELKESIITALLDEKQKWSEAIEATQSDNSVKTSVNRTINKIVAHHSTRIEKEAEQFACLDGNQSKCKSDLLPVVEDSMPSSSSTKDCTRDSGNSTVKSSDLKLRQQLKEFCETMDGNGLRRFMVEKRKDVNGLRNELPCALRSASNPAILVLDSLKDYCFANPQQQQHSQQQHSQQPQQHQQPQDRPQQGANDPIEKKESWISASRRACILLMECLCQVLAHPTLGSEVPVVSSDIKEQAKTIADEWRIKMGLDREILLFNSVDAQAFLQLLGTFDVAAEYEKDVLCRLVTAVARRRQTPSLCRALGLTDKIPDIVDQLATDGKQMEAISLAHAFGIMDRIQPGPLLKAYVKEAKKSAQLIVKTGLNSPAALNDSTTKELAALKSVLKCIEEFDLESELPSSPLQKRVLQLEKSKSDRKRVAVAVKAQAKRPRANITAGLSHISCAPPERQFLYQQERLQYGSVGLTSYGLPMVERRAQGSYGSAYAAPNCPQVALPPSYLYADGLPSSVYGTAPFANLSSSYGNYQFGNGLPPPTAFSTCMMGYQGWSPNLGCCIK